MAFLLRILKVLKFWTDLLKQFFEIQKKYPAKNDWILTIKEDLETLSLKMTFDEIKFTKKAIFKKIIKEKACLSASEISTTNAKSIFKYRTKMSNVKENFHFMYSEDKLDCPECPGILDTQEHLIEHLIEHFDTPVDKQTYQKLFAQGYHKDKVTLVKNMDLLLNRR